MDSAEGTKFSLITAFFAAAAAASIGFTAVKLDMSLFILGTGPIRTRTEVLPSASS